MGKTKRALLILGTLLVLLVGGRAIVIKMHPQSDTEAIRQALADSIQASREGRPGGVMDKLSDNISYNGQNEGGYQRDIARYIKTSKPDVEVENMDPVVTGDEATIVSPVQLTLSLLGQSVTKQIKEVTLVFRKEPEREFLIIPTVKWKLAEVRVPDSSVQDLVQLHQ